MILCSYEFSIESIVQEISGLEKGIEYEFRVAGINRVGAGQEAIKAYLTPEGVPSDSPKNITTRFQTPDVIEISYDAPPEISRNGQITMYDIQFWKSVAPDEKRMRSTTERKTVFANLEDNTEYKFSVRANTRKGYGPWSSVVSFRTDRNIIRAPQHVRAMATSDSSIEVWWEAVPLRTKVRKLLELRNSFFHAYIRTYMYTGFRLYGLRKLDFFWVIGLFGY